ncbi:16934_t:CDS:1, partial [Gigaspora margarita]
DKNNEFKDNEPEDNKLEDAKFKDNTLALYLKNITIKIFFYT